MTAPQTILLQLELGDVEHLTVTGERLHLRMITDLDGCGSTSILDRSEAAQVRDALTRWLDGAR